MGLWEALLLALLAAGAFSIVYFSLRLGISPMPSSIRARRAMLAMIPESHAGEIHELGAGWGGVALALAARCAQSRVIAWEQSWVPWCVLRLRSLGVANLEVRRADFFGAPLETATILVCYLYPGAMQALARKLIEERPGAEVRVVTNTFAFRGWPVAAEVTVDDVYRTRVVQYTRVPTSDVQTLRAARAP